MRYLWICHQRNQHRCLKTFLNLLQKCLNFLGSNLIGSCVTRTARGTQPLWGLLLSDRRKTVKIITDPRDFRDTNTRWVLWSFPSFDQGKEDNLTFYSHRTVKTRT
ncbi:hypothetical protein VTP01DRAFT_10552 [Rhizomucor pusillus]|uniref:uncharacterized protein n=1 Tax=Rhizomucor pusillus TaxID=4840 RepID=UPI003744A23D